MTLADDIKHKATLLGFDLVGITDASPAPADDVNHLLAWLDAGYAGQMTWMHRNLEKRTDPARLLPGAQSVIVVGLNYKPASSACTDEAVLSEAKDLIPTKSHPLGRVTPYASYEDYHPFIKKLLRKLVDFIIDATGAGLRFQICCDSAPLLERAFAVRAGLGFIGKNHALINPRLGPQILLGEIITNLDLGADSSNGCGSEARIVGRGTLDATDPSRATDLSSVALAKEDRRMTQPEVLEGCRSCNKCLAACPTRALRPDGCFDATKCISYLTIEYDGDIPPDLAPKIGSHLFGCSDCLLACPFQHNAPPCTNKEFACHPDRAALDLNDVLNLSESQFHSRFADSPILRPGLNHLKRIGQLCLNNFTA